MSANFGVFQIKGFNIHSIFPGNRDDIERHDLQVQFSKRHQGVYQEITSLGLGLVFPDTLPWDSISHASLAESKVSTLPLRISFGSWDALAQSSQNLLVVGNVKPNTSQNKKHLPSLWTNRRTSVIDAEQIQHYVFL